MSESGQWKVKFNPKPEKGFFTKLNGDLVKVPLLHHEKYMLVVSHVADLKAQVMNTNMPIHSKNIYTRCYEMKNSFCPLKP